MGLLDSIKKLVKGSDEPAFAVPEGACACPIQIVDERTAKRIADSAVLSVSTRPVRMKDTASGSTVESGSFQGFPVSFEGKPFAIMPTEPISALLTRFDRAEVTAKRQDGALLALLPDGPWFEAASAGILDLPSDVEVIRAYFSDKEWHGMGPGIHPLEPLRIELVGGVHDAAGGQLMNFYAGEGQLVGTLPNKSYSFQKLRRRYPDHILAATAEELAQDHRGSSHCINVFVS